MTILGYAVVDLTSNTIVERPGGLPCRVMLQFPYDGGEYGPYTIAGTVDFDKAGQVAPDAANPTHKILPRVLVGEAPTEPHTVTGATEAIEADQVTVTRTYELLPEPVPHSISDRQFFQQLAVLGKITEAEAEAAVATGEIPAAMLALVDQLPAEQQFPARMLLKGATVFEYSHPMTSTIASLYDWNETQKADLFRAAAVL